MFYTLRLQVSDSNQSSLLLNPGRRRASKSFENLDANKFYTPRMMTHLKTHKRNTKQFWEVAQFRKWRGWKTLVLN